MTPKGTHKPVIQGTFTPAATGFAQLGAQTPVFRLQFFFA